MTTESNAVHDFPADPQRTPPTSSSQPRPFYWSVRREVWENRSIMLAPLLVAAVVLFASLIGTLSLPKKMRTYSMPGAAKQRNALVGPMGIAPAPIMLASLIVGVFYSMDALYGERRDRSILFWKSLPVSDRTTVLSKATVPLLVLPAIAYVLSVITQLILLFASNVVLLGSGMSPAPFWAQLHFSQGLVIMFYGLGAHALWFAPIYGWLLLVSAWAKRAPFLWAILPLMAVSAAEKIVFNSMHFMSMLQYRVGGAMQEAFTKSGSGGNVNRLAQLDPAKFLTSPGLWFGLIFAALCLAAAVRLRRNREPI